MELSTRPGAAPTPEETNAELLATSVNPEAHRLVLEGRHIHRINPSAVSGSKKA
jgi:hypothetical protein